VGKQDKHESVFLFTTWAAEGDFPERSLKDYVLISNRATYGSDSRRNPMDSLPVIEGREVDLIDLRAEKILAWLPHDTTNIIPKYAFGQLNHKELVLKRFVLDDVGQAHLPDIATV